ncbi:PDZ domain-containing protein [Hufsiella ginkgonis]|uniref:Peptide-binding protein n=1 Tax=Hufsiella ginkgonis TaxID=2695274 RepID=A0A7K1XVF0_9SPHI|nr:PDZ domain-containing protein [Hufsiella ginkgonis]MXV14985.1 peptide-binding protein [Hufsiella ginkgonis]
MSSVIKTAIFLLIILLSSTTSPAKNLYVSLTGNDKNPGTLRQPFLTLRKAGSEARKCTTSVTIYIRGGTYYLEVPLIFPGTGLKAGNSLTLRPYKNEKVTISGARRLRLKWRPFRDRILRAPVPGDLVFDQLYVNGTCRQMARYPNYREGIRPYGGTSADAISPGRVKKWQDPAGGFIHAMHTGQWGDMAFRITGKNAGGTLEMEGGWQNNRPSPMHKQYRFVENIFEELDTLNEWFYNAAEKMLYFKPSPGLDLKTAIIEVPQAETLIGITGSSSAPVTHVFIEGIRFTQTTRTFMKTREPLLRSDWAVYRSGAILLSGTKDCRVRNCTLDNIGGNAVMVSGFNSGFSIERSHIYNIGGSAISFIGDPSSVRSPSFRYEHFVKYEDMDKLPGEKGRDFPVSCRAVDNLVHHIGTVEKQVAGIEISMSQAISITHNTIYEVPRAGINIGDGNWGGHLIAYNDVFDTVLETGDHGAFNSWGRDRFWHPKRATMDSLVAARPELIGLDAVKTTFILNNRFRCDNGWDIDLDDGSGNYTIANNVCLNGGIKLREGFGRTVENNIMLNNSFHPHVWFKNSRDVFQRNIVTTAYQPIRINDWGKAVNNNLFPDSISLLNARKNGTDQSSIYGDPQFVDPVNGNYQVKQGSPALKTGFINFPMEFGVRPSHLRALARKVVFPQLAVVSAAADDQLYDFMGMKIKNLHTLAERSATGMAGETGVLVREIAPTSILAPQLRPNDVILEYAGNPIASVKDLFQVRATVQSRRVVPVTIFRDQAKMTLTLTIK